LPFSVGPLAPVGVCDMRAEGVKVVERRQFGRRQAFVHAFISPPGRPVIPCVMRNVSEDGALLEVAHPEWLPRRFRLLVEALGIASDCEIVRRTEATVGVRFAVRIAGDLGLGDAGGRRASCPRVPDAGQLRRA